MKSTKLIILKKIKKNRAIKIQKYKPIPSLDKLMVKINKIYHISQRLASYFEMDAIILELNFPNMLK